MKKIFAVCLIGAALATAVFAQPVQPETITVTGSLVLDNGMIALKNADGIYYVPQVAFLAGFIDGVKEGAAVTVSGYQFNRKKAQSAASVLHVTQLTVGNKNYDLKNQSRDGFRFQNDARNTPPKQRQRRHRD
jgi:opacity protein-like surface antigen